MKKKRLAICSIVALVISTVLTGCSFGGGNTVTPTSLEGTTWEAVSGTMNGQVYDLGDYTLKISFEDGVAVVEAMGEVKTNPYEYADGAGIIDDVSDLTFTVEGHEMKLVSNGIITLEKR